MALVQESALHLLETLGLSQAIPSMVARVTSAGGSVTSDGRLLFPRALVQQALAEVRRDVVLCGQKPEHDLDLSGAHVHMSSGGAAPGVFDIDTRAYRESTVQDLYDAARLCDAMENIHHFSRAVVARDIEDNRVMDLNTAYACLMGTPKHVSISISDPSHVPDIARLCYLMAGGEEAFRTRPFLTVMCCHVVPPMRFAEETCEILEAALLAGFPVQLISAGQAGATSPATVAGSLVQAIAETLAGLVFAWLVAPDARIIFAPKPLVADLRTGSNVRWWRRAGDPDGCSGPDGATLRPAHKFDCRDHRRQGSGCAIRGREISGSCDGGPCRVEPDHSGCRLHVQPVGDLARRICQRQ